MPLLMQRLLKEMSQVTPKDIAAAEPADPPGELEEFVALMPMSGRRIATVLQYRLEELQDRIRWHIVGNHDTIEDHITKLRRYVDFINNTLLAELEELVPEIADLRRQGALITFRHKWQICAMEGAMRPDQGVPMDVVAEYIADLMINDINRETDESANAPPSHEPPDPSNDSPIPPDSDGIPGPMDDLLGPDLSLQMDKLGWFERAMSIVEKKPNE